MKKILLASAMIGAGLLALQGTAEAHGGTYRGPGDTVPPGGGGSGGGGAPSSPSGPTSGGGSGPSTPSPAGPGSPGGAPGAAPGAPVSGGGDDIGADLTLWSFWWEFNKDPYLNLKSKVHSGGVVSGSTGFFLGRGETEESKDTLRPSEAAIRGKVVPALLETLKTETDRDIITGAMIALAKIGDEKSEGGVSLFEKEIARFLPDGDQEVAETAAIALGILANDASIQTLKNLLEDNPAGRALVGTTEVEYRRRAFAAYGLSLVGKRTASEENRVDIIRSLAQMLVSDKTSTRDVKVACMISLGLVRVEGTMEPATPPEKGKLLPAETSRVSQLEFVLDYFLNEQNNYLVRAHAPTALARLCDGLPEPLYSTYKERIANELLKRSGTNSKEPAEVLQSCILALGLLGDNDSDTVDVEIRKLLINQGEINDLQARNFSNIALAQVGARQGKGEPAKDDKEVQSALLKTMARGKDALQPWAGLALGVYGHALAQRSQVIGTDVNQALVSRLADEKSPLNLGAYAIGVGIMGAQEGESVLLEKLENTKDDLARGYCAVGLGLLGARGSIEPIQAIVKDSKYRPDLLKQAAIGLGLLGDKVIVDDLLVMLSEAKGLATQASIASALGFIGDARSIDPLVAMLKDKTRTQKARGFAAVALGIVADKELLPWNSKISVDINYRASTQTLNDQGGTGILNIL